MNYLDDIKNKIDLSQIKVPFLFKKPNKFQTSGVYCCYCLANNKYYIGSAKNLIKRKSSHKRQLEDNKHHNEHLQNAYNKYGKENFVFFVMEFTTKEDTIKRERFYLDQFKSYNHDKGFNISNQAGVAIFLDDTDLQKKLINLTSSEYKVISPDGQIFQGKNKKKFCEAWGFNYFNFCSMTYGHRNEYRGWINCPNNIDQNLSKTELLQLKRDTNKICKFYTFEKDGNEINIYNLNNFCKENDLIAGRMLLVYHGGTDVPYQGYISKKNNLIYQRQLLYEKPSLEILDTTTNSILKFNSVKEFAKYIKYNEQTVRKNLKKNNFFLNYKVIYYKPSSLGRNQYSRSNEPL